MKKLFFAVCLFFSSTAFADNECFLAMEKNKILKQDGSDCNTRYTPQSSFKIALSIMGFDSGVLKDENTPVLPCKGECDYFINVCKGSHTPKTWMRDSCLWYSRLITPKIGMEKFQDYIKKFNYGNKDLSGDNPILNSWISSSLKISSFGQIEFLQKFIDQDLSVSAKAYDLTKKIIFIQELPGGWKLYGKTGNGKLTFQQGWFVGFIEKNGRSITFASHLTDDKQQDSPASFRARNSAMLKLWNLINELEE